MQFVTVSQIHHERAELELEVSSRDGLSKKDYAGLRIVRARGNVENILPTVSSVEQVCVLAGAANQRIEAQPTMKEVGPGAATEKVVVSATEEKVASPVAAQEVVPVAAIEVVVAFVRAEDENRVVACQHVVTCP